MMENRSFDNLFGRFPGVNGTTVGVKCGRGGAADQVSRLAARGSPARSRGRAQLPERRQARRLRRRQRTATRGRTRSSRNNRLPNYWHWAREYALSDNFYASALGPSYPNHFFFIAGQSGGVIDNPENILVRPGKDGEKPFKSWGCDALGDDVFVLVKDDKGNLSKHDSCFNFKTVGQQLTEIGIDWRLLLGRSPGRSGYFWNAYNGIHDVFHTDLWHEHAQNPIDRLIDDIQANALPAVTWVTPQFELSDHPPASSSFAHNWLTDIVNAVMKSDMWDQTAIFITWDEWGGFYDSVMPPAVDDVGLGFRVPLLTISPYARRGLIDDEMGEFSSPLRFISDNWGLDPLTPRIANTHNFEHVFDFSAPPRPPAIATAQAKTYGDPFDYPDDYPGWPEGTNPVEEPF